MITWDGRASCVEARRAQKSVDQHTSHALRELKLNAQDSLVSDHLLLVADFQLVH